MDQVKGNLVSAGRSGIGTVTSKDQDLIKRIREKYRSMIPIPCTGCGYCVPCPNGVDIPGNFELFNNGFIHEDMRTSRISYTRWFPKDERANKCTQCKTCEKKCPQKIKISEQMPRVHKALSKGIKI
jgi:predicted aldo/keto reductase-like oxidoreductase